MKRPNCFVCHRPADGWGLFERDGRTIRRAVCNRCWGKGDEYVSRAIDDSPPCVLCGEPVMDAIGVTHMDGQRHLLPTCKRCWAKGSEWVHARMRKGLRDGGIVPVTMWPTSGAGES